METISAVIVTFNRKKLLLECIKSLLIQTHKIKHIYIIDNASTDGTKEYLEDNNILDNKCIHYIKKDTNSGGAGGFKTGLEKAIACNTDWIWLMDDDVVAKPLALEKLLEFKTISSCIHPSREYLDGLRFHWNHNFDENIGIVTSKQDFFIKDKKWIEMNTGCFEGMLIKTEIAKSIPLPEENFFIGCDDLLYGFYASTKTNVLYVRDSLLIKKIRPQRITPFRAYYELRNKILLRRKLKEMGIAKKRFWPLFFIHLTMLSVFYITEMRSLKGIIATYKAWVDGLKNRGGKVL